MRKIIFITIVLLGLTCSGFSQSDATTSGKMKFNGTWVFDAKQSKADSYYKKLYKGQDLQISYVEPEFKIIEPRTRDGETRHATSIFFTDGRGEQNKPYAFNQDAIIDSITKWENDVLVRKYKIPLNLNGQPAGASSYVEKYSISSDGLILTIIREFSMDAEAAKAMLNKEPKDSEKVIVKRVYRKK